MDILTWNIRHGGKKTEINYIIDSLKYYNADVIIITEFRENNNGENIKNKLHQSGWIYQYSSLPPRHQNGVLILSKTELEVNDNIKGLPKAKHRWLDLRFKDIDLSIMGVHIPGYGDKWDKKDFWEHLLKYAKRRVHENSIIIGDFNTGLSIDCEGKMFKYSEYMEELIKTGWIDTWREYHGSNQEYTWYSNSGNGFRIDYAFVTKSILCKLKNVNYSHKERVDGYSDHSLLSVELDISMNT